MTARPHTIYGQFSNTPTTVLDMLHKSLESFLKRYPVISRVSLKWGEMDSFQHINNVQYLKYQEDARLKFFDEFLKEVNPDQFDIKAFDEGTGIGPILSNTSCSYKFPLTYPDKILVGATILDGDMTKDRYKLTHAIWSLKHQRVVAKGYGTVVCYDFANGKVQNIPEVMKEAIETILRRNSLDIYDHVVKISQEFDTKLSN